MSEKSQIIFMQIRLIRLAAEELDIPIQEINALFKKYAVDLMVTMVVEELAEDLQEEPKEMLSKFIASKTGELLYDEESKLWWSGPSDIAQMYKKEIVGR